MTKANAEKFKIVKLLIFLLFKKLILKLNLLISLKFGKLTFAPGGIRTYDLWISRPAS